MQLLSSFIQTSLSLPKQTLGFQKFMGVLVIGPCGSGKTRMIQNTVKSLALDVAVLRFFGASSIHPLKSFFRKLSHGNTKKSVIIVDDIDVLYESNFSAVHTLLQFMDWACENQLRVCVVAASRSENLPSKFFHYGRFSSRIQVSVPNEAARRVMLKDLAANNSSEDVEWLVKRTMGFTPFDLKRLHATATLTHELSSNSTVECIPLDAYRDALTKIKPVHLIKFGKSLPFVNWSGVGGYRRVKQQLMEFIEWPVNFQSSLERFKIQPPSGLLLHGPSGCGKTLMVHALRSNSLLNFVTIEGTDVFSKWFGEAESVVRELFACARRSVPCVVFIDELDALTSKRSETSGASNVFDRVLGQLLTEMDGIESSQKIFVIGCTNRMDKLDPALLRPGRIERKLHVGLPTHMDRQEILNVLLKDVPCHRDVETDVIASECHGFTGADLSALVRDAALTALRENKHTREIQMRHFRSVLKRMTFERRML